MKRLLDLVGMSVGGWLGWTAGAAISLFTAFIVGSSTPASARRPPHLRTTASRARRPRRRPCQPPRVARPTRAPDPPAARPPAPVGFPLNRPAPVGFAIHDAGHIMRAWCKQAEERARLTSCPGRGWHALRRKFASDLVHTPMKVLCELGGWRDQNTILKCYQHPHQDQLAGALVSRRTHQSPPQRTHVGPVGPPVGGHKKPPPEALTSSEASVSLSVLG